MVKCYHHACDNVTNLLTDENIKFLGKTADAITATLNKLSETSGGKQFLNIDTNKVRIEGPGIDAIKFKIPTAT